MEQHFLVRVGPPQSLEDLRRSIRQRRPGCQVFAQTDDVSVQRATGRLAVPRDFTETRYAAQSWPRPRRVVARIEATLKGLDTRYVVTNIARGSAQWLYGLLS
jgi:Transposase DDE domain group 1